MDRLLNEVEIRVLGCLIEKESTTPEYYPLSLNGLTNACNQKSNRNPVVSFDESTVSDAVKSLQRDRLILIASGGGQRVRKYLHKFKEVYFVSQKAQAVMGTLMVRGAQTLGEIRTRTERIYSFADLKEVQETLEELKDRENPLVVQLPRVPGHKESRYMHTLAGKPEIAAENEPAFQEPAPQAAVKTLSLADEVAALRREVEALKVAFEKFKSQFD